jgi:hypothetical protein
MLCTVIYAPADVELILNERLKISLWRYKVWCVQLKGADVCKEFLLIPYVATLLSWRM